MALGVRGSWRSSLSVWRSSASLSAQQQWSQVSAGQLRPRYGLRRHSSLPSTPNTPSEVPPPVSGLTLALAGGPQAPSAEQELGNEGTRGCSLSSAPQHAPGVLLCVLIWLSLRPQRTPSPTVLLVGFHTPTAFRLLDLGAYHWPSGLFAANACLLTGGCDLLCTKSRGFEDLLGTGSQGHISLAGSAALILPQ